MVHRDEIEAAIEAWSCRSQDSRSFDPEAWPLSYQELVSIVAAFCLDLPADRGDRISVERRDDEPNVAWLFKLDDTEIGQFQLEPLSDGGYRRTESYIALKRGANAASIHNVPAIERDRHELFISIMRDLERHVELQAGVRKPGGRVQWRRVFWSEPPTLPVSDELSERNRVLLKMWRDDYTAKEIALQLSLSEGRVRNILTELRKRLGQERVPYHT